MKDIKPIAEVTQVVEHDIIQVIEGVPVAFSTVIAKISGTLTEFSSNIFSVKILTPDYLRDVQIEPTRLTDNGEFQFNTSHGVEIGERLEISITLVAPPLAI